MKVRNLTEAERTELRNRALEMFWDDCRSDPDYATETVKFLAEDKDDQWWIEFMSSDPGCVIEHLSFNPYEREEQDE